MFNFMNMIANHEERCVDNFDNDVFIVDTALVSDGIKPYETGISHPLYNNEKWIIVESYDDKKTAQEGHNKWVEIMTSDKLPEYLEDCKNTEIAQFVDNSLIYYKNNK